MVNLFKSAKTRHEIECWYGADQGLGQKIGSIDIKCTLRADSIWTARARPGYGMSGLLYFEIKYTEEEGISIRSARVHIDVASPTNKDPIPTFEGHAPQSDFTDRAFRQHVTNTRTIDPRFEVNVAEVGVSASGYTSTTTREFDEDLQWSFAATRGNSGNGDPRVTHATFTWSCESEKNQSGMRRPFHGALSLQREQDVPLVLLVSVEATPFKPWHRLRWNRRQQCSRPIGGPRSERLPPIEFGELCRRLESDVFNWNMGNRSTSTQSTSAAPVALTGGSISSSEAVVESTGVDAVLHASTAVISQYLGPTQTDT